MRFTLSSSVLNSKLSTLSKVIASKNSMQILDCFLFEISSGQLTITATDNSNMMKCNVELSESDGDGAFCVHNHIIQMAVKEMAEQPITFEVNVDDNSIMMTYQNGSYRFVGQSADDFPKIQPLSSPYTEASISAGALAQNIQRTLFATSSEELHLVMTGIYFDLKEDSLNIVASDGYKLVRNILYSCKTELPAAFLLPKKPASLLRNMLDATDENPITMRFNDKQAEFSTPNGYLSCTLIEGRYPKYNNVIPTDNPNIVTVDRKSFMSALRRVLPFANEATGLVKFRLSLNNIELNAEDINFATSAHEDIICEYNGVPMSIGFKGSAMYEIMNNISSDDIIIELGDPSRAGVIHPTEQPEGEDVLMLIMPMLLNE